MEEMTLNNANKLLASLRAITIKLDGTSGEGGVLKEITHLVNRLESNKTSYSGLIQAFNVAAKALSSSKKENASLTKKLDDFLEVITDIQASFFLQHNSNARMEAKHREIIQFLENWNTSLLEMKIEKEMQSLKENLVSSVKKELSNELSRHKTKWYYLISAGIGLFLLGGAAFFYIVNYIVMGMN